MALTSTLVDSAASLAQLIDTTADLPGNPPSLYLDIEGINLSRLGSISILQILVHPQNAVYLIDVHVLGNTAFTTAGKAGTTLKSILESAQIPKVFFDVRNDSDALFAHFGIALQGTQDIQLMENASRGPNSSKRLLNGLARCIERDAPISLLEKQVWRAAKEKGARLFAPEKGGSYEVFNKRPLDEDIRAYCVQDVKVLPGLCGLYWRRLGQEWRNKVEHETRERVRLSQSSTYQPHGMHKALGPW